MSAIADDVHIPEQLLPEDELELLSVPPDGASLDGAHPTPGLPLETSSRSDLEAGSEAERWQVPPTEDGAAELAAAAPMHVSGDGLHLIEGFEGYSGVQYRDSVGVPTIGYGTTSSVIYPLPRTCTRAQAEGWLRLYVQRSCEPAIRSTGCPLNQHQFDALCSFIYNEGPGTMSSSWTIGRDLRARNVRAAADSLLRYDTAGGQVLAGLARRRQSERALFLEPVPPVDPHHLARYVNSTFDLGGRKINERGTLERWFQLLPQAHSHVAELHRLQADIVLLRKRVWAVAHWDKPASWAISWRGWRWQDLWTQSRVQIH